MKKSSVIAALIIFGVIGAVAGSLAFIKYRQFAVMQHGGGFEPAEAVETVAAREVPWRPMADLVGTVIALRSVSVSNELAGTIKRLGFDSGAIVEAGSVLLELDDSSDRADYEAAMAAVRVAQANVGVADAQLRWAGIDLKRVEAAINDGGANPTELDRARTELERLQADRQRTLAEVEQAKARAAQVQTRLDKMVIKAPFRARAGLRNIHEGQYLAEGTSIVMLEEVGDTIFMDFAVPQEYLARVRPGLAVMATSSALGDEPVRIEVAAIDARVNNDTRNVRVRAVVANPDERLRPGMFVQIRVPTDVEQPRLVVPSTAVRRAPHADTVYVVAPDEKDPQKLRAKERVVKLGPTIGADVIVTSGLAPGELVAATGSFKLREGVQVMPTNGAPPAGSAPTTSAGAESTPAAADSVASKSAQ